MLYEFEEYKRQLEPVYVATYHPEQGEAGDVVDVDWDGTFCGKPHFWYNALDGGALLLRKDETERLVSTFPNSRFEFRMIPRTEVAA